MSFDPLNLVFRSLMSPVVEVLATCLPGLLVGEVFILLSRSLCLALAVSLALTPLSKR